MRRGEIHYMPVPLPDWENVGDEIDQPHFVITLRYSEPGTEDYVPFVIATSNKRTTDTRFNYEVHIDGGQGAPFPVSSIIDCRWILTRPCWEFTAGTYRGDLDAENMHAISLGIVEGLQLL